MLNWFPMTLRSLAVQSKGDKSQDPRDVCLHTCMLSACVHSCLCIGLHICFIKMCSYKLSASDGADEMRLFGFLLDVCLNRYMGFQGNLVQRWN